MEKVTIIGAGNVGASAAMALAKDQICDVVMLDVAGDLARGKALDMAQAMAAYGSDVKIIGTDDYKDIAGSKVVVITAGVPRKPGMTREDLLDINKKISADICKGIKENAPDSIVINVANPMDAITAFAFKQLGFPKERVIGMGGVLDGFRFANKVKKYLGVSYKDISPMVIGMHGEKMVPVPQYTTIKGIPLTEMAEDDLIEKIVDETAKGGAEIVGFLKTGSAFYGPGDAIKTMVESIIKDDGKIVCAAAYLSGEYGYNGIFLGVPIRLGSNGVREIVEVSLPDDIKEKLDEAAEAAKKLSLSK